MIDTMLSEYFYGDESGQFNYFRIPCLLITSPRFKHVSTDAKLLYREASDSLIPALTDTVERHITKYGVTDFYVGHYGGFDRLAAQVVKLAKISHPEVKLIMVLPYRPAERAIELPEGFDGTFYPPLENVPRRFAIVRANRYMVDNCSHLISYVCHPGSNAHNR